MTKSLLLMMELGIPWLNTRLVHILPSHPSLLGVTHAASEFVQDLMYPLWFNHIQGEQFCIPLQILIPIATSKSFQRKSSIMFVLSCHNFIRVIDGMKYN